MDQQMGVISVEKKENGVISIEKEMKEIHLEQKDVKTPNERISGFRNIESLLENPKKRETIDDYRRDNEYNMRHMNEVKRNENEVEEEVEVKYIPKEEDFPELMNKKVEETKSCWNNFKKDVGEIIETVNEINRLTRQSNIEIVIKNDIKRKEEMREAEREERVEEYIKKVKKNYDKEYIVYDMDTYILDELQYYIDDDDITNEYILYEEMLDEVRYTDVVLDKLTYDNDNYYIYYDLESKFYQQEEGDLVPFYDRFMRAT
jgi:hypothetical protein